MLWIPLGLGRDIFSCNKVTNYGDFYLMVAQEHLSKSNAQVECNKSILSSKRNQILGLQQIPKTLQESRSKTQKIASKNQPNITKKPTQSKIPKKCLCKPIEKPIESHQKTQKNNPKQPQNNPISSPKTPLKNPELYQKQEWHSIIHSKKELNIIFLDQKKKKKRNKRFNCWTCRHNY